jgi:succinate dehydrogenase hydrophobic anchor subunit
VCVGCGEKSTLSHTFTIWFLLPNSTMNRFVILYISLFVLSVSAERQGTHKQYQKEKASCLCLYVCVCVCVCVCVHNTHASYRQISTKNFAFYSQNVNVLATANTLTTNIWFFLFTIPLFTHQDIVRLFLVFS